MGDNCTARETKKKALKKGGVVKEVDGKWWTAGREGDGGELSNLARSSEGDGCTVIFVLS